MARYILCLCIGSVVCSLNTPASCRRVLPEKCGWVELHSDLDLALFQTKAACYFPYVFKLEPKFDALFKSLPLNRYLALPPPLPSDSH